MSKQFIYQPEPLIVYAAGQQLVSKRTPITKRGWFGNYKTYKLTEQYEDIIESIELQGGHRRSAINKYQIVNFRIELWDMTKWKFLYKFCNFVYKEPNESLIAAFNENAIGSPDYSALYFDKDKKKQLKELQVVIIKTNLNVTYYFFTDFWKMWEWVNKNLEVEIR